jgi:hypothetical protein
MSKKKKDINKTILNNAGELASLAGLLSNNQAFSNQVTLSDTLLINNRYYPISNDRNLLSWSFLNHGIIQTLIKQPVEDAFRGGIIITTQQLSLDNIDVLNSFIEKYNTVNIFKEGVVWAKTFGGAGIVIETAGDPEKPIIMDNINETSELNFKAADLWELYYTPNNANVEEKPYSPDTIGSNTPYNYYGHALHKSRVIPLKNKQAPSLLRPMLRGWGMSDLETIIVPINQYLKSQAVIFELLDEAKIDVYKIDGYNERLLSPDGGNAVAQRIQIANQIKNFQSAITMDVNDDYQQKILSVPGLSDMLKEIRMTLAANVGMPINKLFGESASGFSSGEDAIENYNAMIESNIRKAHHNALLSMVQLICKKLFNFIPNDLIINYHSLRMLNSEQESIIQERKFNKVMALVDRQIITAKQAVEMINAQNLFDVEIPEDKIEDKFTTKTSTGILSSKDNRNEDDNSEF